MFQGHASDGRTARGPRGRATERSLACAVLAAALLAAAGRSAAEGRGASARGESEVPRVDAVYYHGRIHTMDPARPLVEAIAVAGGRIAATGSTKDLLAAAPEGAARVDLGGRAVVPGLTDAHAHFLGFAKLATRIDLAGTASLEEVLARVEARRAATPAGAWILGRGWDQNDWPETRYPGRAPLDRIAPANPVYLVRVCGHAAYVNSEALRLAGISRLTPDPPGGKIVRDADGEPTGILLDAAAELVARVVPPTTREEKKRLLVDAARACLAAGLVGAHDMGTAPEDVSIYDELTAAGALPFRITAYLSSDDPAIGPLLAAGPRPGRGDELFRIVGAKFYADGSLGARSAALLEDYADDPGNRGILMQTPDSLYRLVAPWRERGFRIAVHAIGDAGVREALDAFERLGGGADARHRVEHAQVIAPADLPRFAALGVIPSMQFTHCTSDMSWAEARLGPERIGGAYAWRSLVSSGSRIPGGSDFPVESIDPFLGIYAAVSRADTLGRPPGGWRGSERLTVEEAVAAFTVNAAYAAAAEGVQGSLAPGKVADFVVLSQDIFEVAPEAIPHTRALATFVGGVAAYRSNAF